MTYYITTPLFYVNDLPHIGSAYPTIATDFFAGHMLQRGEEVAFLTGTDEHGQKIEKAAAANHKSPQEHCDFIAEEFNKLWKILDINYDYFVRTSAPAHRDYVTEFFQKVRSNGDIYKGQYTGLYCTHCEDFWLEKDLIEESKTFLCPTHKKAVEEYSQENYFFALSKYQDKLQKHIDDNPDFISPDYRKNEVLGWLKDGLRDFPISRANLSWGIPVPGDTEGQVVYVWFDALLGYLSGLGSEKDKFWQTDSVIHIIGKDILRFHAVYWPAMLMSAGLALPKKVFGHGFLTKDGMKMGKTLGNIIDPIALTEEFGAEALKFYFLREIMFGKDGDYTDESFIQRLNSDLANNLGNLLNRSLKLINKYFDSKIPNATIDPQIKQNFSNLELNFRKHIDDLNPYAALEELFKTLDSVNVLINDVAPWKILKDESASEEAKSQAASSLTSSVYACRQAAIYLSPIMPNIATQIFTNIGIAVTNEARDKLLSETFNLSKLQEPIAGLTVLAEPLVIFNRLEKKEKTAA